MKKVIMKSEKEFIKNAKVGDLIKILLQSKNHWTAYEGKVDERESMIEKGECSENIFSYRSYLKYLQFGGNSIDFNSLHYNFEVYTPEHSNYKKAREILEKSNCGGNLNESNKREGNIRN